LMLEVYDRTFEKLLSFCADLQGRN
jgi:hypothetical protein